MYKVLSIGFPSEDSKIFIKLAYGTNKKALNLGCIRLRDNVI